MAEMDTASRLRGLIVDYAGVSPEKVTDEARLLDDLDLDSLDKVEVVMAAEDEFRIEISDDEAQHLQTFGECVRLVDQRLA